MIANRRFWQIAAVTVLGFSMSAAAQAAGWRDDFNDGSTTDGNPVTWMENVGGFFPGTYNATSGDYVLTAAEDFVDNSQMSGFVPVSFTDVYVRTQGTILPDPNDPNNVGGNLVVLGRVDLNNFTGYLMYFDVSGNLNLQILAGFDTNDIGVTWDAPFNASSEVIIEMNIIGDQLSGYAWEANDPNGKPAVPQVTATDTNFTAGFAGIAFAEDDDHTTGVFRYAAAQDTPFVDASNGDFDGDNIVDGADYLIWQRGLGGADPDGSMGDANGDHNVDGVDLGVWAEKFGGAPAIGAVPEPAAGTLAVVASLAGLAARGRKRTRSAG
jgi:hypothetical protein